MSRVALPIPAERSSLEIDTLRRLSAWMAAACLTLIVVLPLLVPIYWWTADATSLAVRASLHPSDIQGSLQTWQRLASTLLTEVPVVLISLGLAQARICFAGFARGQVFTTQAVSCLRRFAAWTFASALAAMVTGSVISVVLTLGNAAGTRHLAIAVGTDQVFTLLFAATVWLMAAVIGHGRLLAEENAAFL